MNIPQLGLLAPLTWPSWPPCPSRPQPLPTQSQKMLIDVVDLDNLTYQKNPTQRPISHPCKHQIHNNLSPSPVAAITEHWPACGMDYARLPFSGPAHAMSPDTRSLHQPCQVTRCSRRKFYFRYNILYVRWGCPAGCSAGLRIHPWNLPRNCISGRECELGPPSAFLVYQRFSWLVDSVWRAFLRPAYAFFTKGVWP